MSLLNLKFKNNKYSYNIYSFQKTKLCYNAVSKEIYCSVELVVIIIRPQLPDNPTAQIQVYSAICSAFLIDKLIFFF